MNEVRMARLYVAAELVLEMLRAYNDNARVVIDGLPADAKVKHVCAGPGYADVVPPNTISLVLESAEFAPVPPGQDPPILDLACRRYSAREAEAR